MVGGNLTDAYDLTRLPADLRAKADGFELSALADLVATWKDRFSPDDCEASALFQCAFSKLEDLVAAGACERTMKARQIAWISRNVPALAKNEAALRRMYNRLLVQWRKGGRRLSSLLDKRPTAGAKAKRAPGLPKEDFDRLSITAVVECNGSVNAAWQRCYSSLTAETRARYPLRREVPAKVRLQLVPEVQRLMPQHIGPRAARLNGAYITRDYSNLFAGDVDSMDDHTLDVYSYRPEEIQKLFRPQLLLQIDVRSGFIYNFALELDRSWTAVTALGLIRRKAKAFGLPRRGWYWERGKFKDAKILGRGGFSNLFTDERENFADRLGLEIKHALPGNARAKVVERVIGSITARLAGLPGYIGRDEMHVKYERVHQAKLEVEAGRVHPAKHFLSVDQLEERLQQEIDAYNSTPRDSEVAGGLMSPADAYENLQKCLDNGEVDPVAKLPETMEYLLSAYIDRARVTRAGISLFNGKYRYYSRETGEIEGEWCKVYFDPERPESIAITNMEGENVRTIPLLLKPDAWSALPAELAEAAAAAGAHTAAQRRRYTELRSNYYPPVRTVLVDPASLEKGRAIAEQRQQLEVRTRRRGATELESAEEQRQAEFKRRVEEADRYEMEHPLDFV